MATSPDGGRITEVQCWACDAPQSADYRICSGCFTERYPEGAEIFDSEGVDGAPLLDSGNWRRSVANCQILGGYGFPVAIGDEVTLRFDGEGMSVAGQRGTIELDYAEVTHIGFSGPGSVQSGGGFIGGGFGVEGAITGIAIASVLNAFTTRTTVITVLELVCPDRELYLLYGGAEPAVMRIELAPVFVALRQARAAS